MGAPEIFLEHKRGEKVQKYLRLNPERQLFLIGSSREADLRITGEGVSGCHAVLRYRAPHWYVCDVSGTESVKINDQVVAESRIDQSTKVEIGNHRIVLFAKDRTNELFKENQSEVGQALHQVVVRVKGRVIETQLLGATEKFKFRYGQTQTVLEAPSSPKWVTTTLGVRTIEQRLIGAQELADTDAIAVDQNLRKPMIVALLLLMLVFASTWTLTRVNKTTKLALDNRSMEMIFDAKTIKKKREESRKVVKEKAHLRSTTMAASEPQAVKAPPPEEATAPKVTSKATAAVSSLRNSGLQSLIGKIAKRANKQGALIAAVGVTPDKVVSGRAVFSTGTSLEGGGKAAKESANFRLGGVATHGKAGGVGVGSLREGAKLAGGSVGTGGVVALSDDEETVIEGGLDKDAIAEVIRRNLGQIRYCYERQLSSNRDLYGKVLVKFTIGATGTVAEQRVDNSTLKSAMVEGCILRRLAGWKFPLPKGGTQVRVSYPFLFKALD